MNHDIVNLVARRILVDRIFPCLYSFSYLLGDVCMCVGVFFARLEGMVI